MDPIDEQITSTLRDGKPMSFEELLSKLSVSHNTLRLHLDKLVDQKLILKEKSRKGGSGEADLRLTR